MGRKSLIHYILISFIIFGIYGFFFPLQIASALTILLLGVIFRCVIGTTWRDSFILSALNYFWILIYTVFFSFAVMMMVVNGESTVGAEYSFLIFLFIIGVPVTYIWLNWTGKRRLQFSLYDKLILKMRSRGRTNGHKGGKRGGRKSHRGRKNSNRRIKGSRRKRRR